MKPRIFPITMSENETVVKNYCSEFENDLNVDLVLIAMFIKYSKTKELCSEFFGLLFYDLRGKYILRLLKTYDYYRNCKIKEIIIETLEKIDKKIDEMHLAILSALNNGEYQSIINVLDKQLYESIDKDFEVCCKRKHFENNSESDTDDYEDYFDDDTESSVIHVDLMKSNN